MIYTLGDRKLETVGDDYYVAPGAQVIGSVTLGRGATVWFNCVLRADSDRIVVGDGTNIQDGSIIHVDEGSPVHLGNNVTLGHRTLVHSCSVGDGSLIGMGAILLNGARIGTNSIVGAGAVVTEGKTFPDNSLVVGAPARVIRSLDEKAVQMIAHGADVYVRRWKHYAGALKRIE